MLHPAACPPDLPWEGARRVVSAGRRLDERLLAVVDRLVLGELLADRAVDLGGASRLLEVMPSKSV